ncbi:MAG: VanW family protein [bacterium]
MVERHAHAFAPSYVAPGRDAAVAQYDIDLRFRNPYPWPIYIHAGIVGDRLEIRVHGGEKPKPRLRWLRMSCQPPRRGA